jgi:hypothetical protein
LKRFSQAELALIKGMIDELVVNGGILDLNKLKISSDNIDVNRLTNIACQYYRMIREGRLSFDYSDIEKYLHLINQSGTESLAGFRCFSCGAAESVTATQESSFIPLCQSCHSKLDADISVISTLMPE